MMLMPRETVSMDFTLFAIETAPKISTSASIIVSLFSNVGYGQQRFS
jgi:hypothetical protein